MNYWTQLSIDYAQQRSYLDDLFQVYPTIPDWIREVDVEKWGEIEKAFWSKDNEKLLRELIKLDLFPIKDSYVAYLKRDPKSIIRNPRTINRISGRLYEMGIDKMFERCSEPKETNRQIWPFFRRWVESWVLGVPTLSYDEFKSTSCDAVLVWGDAQLMKFGAEELNYQHGKGLDLVARFNWKYVIGEAKFLTDFGGHQNAQFNDAISTILAPNVQAVKVAILDWVLYIWSKNKMHRDISTTYSELNIMSALVLREFLYQI
jgi:hypothetical protein